MTIIRYVLSLILTIFISICIYLDKYSLVLIYWWFASIFFLVMPILLSKKIEPKKISYLMTKKNLAFLLIIFLPIFVRVSNLNLSRIHGDEVLTAYFSATEDFTKVNFFSGIPSDKTQWQSQFPSPFFVLQRLFFIVFGENLMTIKLSSIPYIFIISLMLFLITKRLFNSKTAMVATILYSVFAISLYYDTFGLIFTSGTTVFMIFFYTSLLYLKKQSVISAALVGISCGFCYLFYTAAFIAFPIMLLFFLYVFIKGKKFSIAGHLLIAFVGFLTVLGPFLTYALKYDNYFTSRTNQVSLLTGSWSSGRERIEKGENPLIILNENAINSFKSLYLNGIGGGGGFDFSHQAVFDRITLSIFTAGLSITIILLTKKPELIFVLVVIFMSFMTVVLSFPPPGYQRFIIAFPFISIILSVPIYLLLSLKKIDYKIRYSIIILILSVYTITNFRYFQSSVKTERHNEDLFISEYINEYFPNRSIHIASYPGFGFDKLYFFSPGKNALSVDTAYHDSYLNNFNPQEKYVYVILFPQDFNSKFETLDKNGKIVFSGKALSLFAN